MAYIKSAAQEFNLAFWEKMQDPGLQKEAADSINDWVRIRVREDGFADKILPCPTISADELDRQLHTDKPVKIIDKEPNQPPAVSVPYGALPINFYMYAPKFAVTFARILSPRFTKDMSELRTYTIDVRQVMADNAIKDMLAEIDTQFIYASNICLNPSLVAGGASPMTGSIQWLELSGGITRESYKESRKTMPRTPYHLEASIGVMNNVTVYEFQKWGRDEWGGDGAEDMLVNGWSRKRFDNLDWIFTIKRDLVPDNTIYYYADPKFLGKAFELEPFTMFVKREFYFMEFFLYTERGAAIANSAGITRHDFV